MPLLEAVLASLLALLALTVIRSPSDRTFPGPKQWPIIGNILPKHQFWSWLSNNAETYGPVYSLRFLFTPILVINSASAARELLDGKSSLYLTRDVPEMIKMGGLDRGVVFDNDPTRHRKSRRMMNAALGPREIELYQPHINEQSLIFLNNMLETPDDFVKHLKRLVAGVALQTTHGYRVQTHGDPYVALCDEVADYFSEVGQPGRWLVDYFPFLSLVPRFLPGMDFKRKALDRRQAVKDLAEKGHTMVQESIASGKFTPSITSKALCDSDYRNDKDHIMHLATDVYTAGADTNVSLLLSFILVMLVNRPMQKRAQDEIDHILGNSRLPEYSDLDELPYVAAIMKEVMRCFPSLPINARRVSEDDSYRGYRIRKGTTVIINIWGLLRDKSIYPDPHTFNPDRWLDQASTNSNGQAYPQEIFGFGRRICPGRYLAERTLFLSIARMLAVFDILPHQDKNGIDVVPERMEFTDGIMPFPKEFECQIVPRSASARDLVNSAIHATA